MCSWKAKDHLNGQKVFKVTQWFILLSTIRTEDVITRKQKQQKSLSHLSRNV